MERKIGEVFECDGVKLRVEQEFQACEGCYFYQFEQCDGNRSVRGECQSASRSDGGVIFRKVEDMEKRTVKLTLEKAKEFYKKGGEFRDLALSAYTEEELTKVVLPETWEEFCQLYKIQKGEYIIDENCSILTRSAGFDRDDHFCRNILPSRNAAEAHLALMQIHQLRDCYRQGWKPDWSNKGEERYSIIHYSTGQYVVTTTVLSCFLTFQSAETAELFLDNFRDLIEKAGDLI